MDVVVYDSLGAQDDAASSTGSLHAKVKALNDDIIPNIFDLHNKSAVLTTGGINAIDVSSTVDIISITGKGVVLFGGLVARDVGTTIYYGIEVDGVEVQMVLSQWMSDLQYLQQVAASMPSLPLGINVSTGITTQTLPEFQVFMLPFQSNFKFRAKNTNAGAVATVYARAFAWHVPG